MTEELKLCPFCGGKASIIAQHGYKTIVRYHAVVCSEECQIYSIQLDKAIEAWNKRTLPEDVYTIKIPKEILKEWETPIDE